MTSQLKTILSGLMILLLLAGSSSAQTDTNQVNRTDAKGLKQGKWRQTYPDGKTKYTGAFKNNKPVGEFLHYHPNGKLKAKMLHHPDGITDASIFDEEGKLTGTGKYKNEKKEGLWSYYNEDGKIRSTEFYKDNLKSGTWRVYYENGVTSEEITYILGKKSGKWKRYTENNVLTLEAEYKNDKLEGIYLVFYTGGKKKISGNYTNDVRTGVWLYYSESGAVEKKETYLNGQLIKEELPKQ